MQWLPLEAIDTNDWSSTQKTWLTYRGSLTKKLRRLNQLLTGAMNHRIYQEAWGAMYHDESEYLGLLPTEPVRVRETDWSHQESLWVMTRCIIPAHTINSKTQVLAHIGERSLGDLLFKDPELQRSEFEFKLLTLKDPYLQRLAANAAGGDVRYWARRSLFYYFEQPLLVMEVFLPTLLAFVMPRDE